jgi:phosphoglycolate phosphatase
MQKNRQERKSVAIFDLDGTLQKTLPSITISANMTLDHFGLPSLSQEIVVGFIGKGARVLAESVMRHSGIDDPDTIEEAFRIYTRIFDEHCTDELEPYDGVPEMFERLLGMGVDVAVVTNKNMSMAPRVLATSFSLDLFSEIRGYSPDFPLKPDASQTIDVLEKLGASPEWSFFIGDSDIDVMTGKNAGMRTVAVKWGYQPIEKLEAVSPDYLAESPEDLTTYIERVLSQQS